MPSGIYKHKSHSKETIRKIVEVRMRNGSYKVSEKTKEKMKKVHEGKHHSEETKEKMKVAHLGKKYKLMSEVGRKNISNALKGKPKNPFTEEHRKNISKARKGKYSRKHSKETIKKIRLAKIEQIKRNNGVVCPNYSPKACEFFKSFDEVNNTKGQYAMYGGGEYFIKELGYFPDYINFEKKFIMEYDEPFHYDGSGYLKERDRTRQEEIQRFYPDFEFRRISQKAEIEFLKVKLL